jgi:hypothetical protein
MEPSLDDWWVKLSRRHFLALGLTAVSGAVALGAANELSRRAGDPNYAARTATLRAELARLMAATGAGPEADTIPIDEGIKTELPEESIR